MAHILVVDDEPHIRFLICKVLEVAGHTIDQAGDGLEALHMLHSQPRTYSLVLTDVQMPKMDGYRLLDLLKRQPFSVPVVILTAHRNLCASAVERGASEGLAKPINRKQLVYTVNRLTSADPIVMMEKPASNAYAAAYK
jgi:CheY-like chemotaxis protein